MTLFDSFRFLPVLHLQQQKRLNELNRDISVPIPERMVMEEALSTPGLAQSREVVFS